ncbi:GDSL-type esterase/lipase family protein [Microbacterium sp. RU33B]|uniref:GDSL-type esterase/lipase family protein n=1 Tax=Microbacterium sp. RU33B TaxID=1907390 RepID=UPI00095CC055|nr:GDSL-type esterase/lipase family protein [Microbacterium sp. RU33B]SIT67688.1 GDSL-like Lipase/Acylhydrolase family protein [Microbacterium sp. RU33B]
MSWSTRARRILASIVAAAVLTSGAVFGAGAASAAPPPPTLVAALGDSITQASMSCSSLLLCPSNSWSTGTAVNSHAQRLKVLNPALTTANLAVPSVTSAALPAQAHAAIVRGAQYVTIEIGANDACTKTVGAMTPTAVYSANVSAAITALGAQGTQIFVASIPNLQRMYDINKSSLSARLTWSVLGLCQSMLANPSSTKAVDVQRRAAVQARVNEYNVALQQACAAVATCRFDGFAVANYAFTKAHISTRDYFHPSTTGQSVLAEITWNASQWAQ